jgi:hypothetical protein
MGTCELNYFDFEQREVAGCREQGFEPHGSIEFTEFLD